MLNKILIANRGEIALRVIRTCKEMGINTVAVYSTADENSLPVKFADEAVCIGPPSSRESYLKIPSILAAAEITNAEAIHPGYGFLSENAEFSRICAEHDLKFIGPSADAIASMGDKSVAKATMEESGVPILPGSEGDVESLEEAEKVAEEIGYPIIIKASSGGGGRGMRVVHEPSDLKKSYEMCRTEAEGAFNDPSVYIEKYIEDPHHVEIQVLGDQYGNVIHLGERDCSLQRRHQKVLEEAPSPIVDEKLRKKMGDAAVNAAKAVDYEGAGTVEFLVDKNHKFYFMEMNTRIQVEHPVTEEITDYDLVEEQIRVASGEKLKDKPLEMRGHAIECRINAEDPAKNFRPTAGTIEVMHPPGGHSVRLDTHAYAGYRIPPHYDSMVAKLIVRAPDRPSAIRRMRRALSEFIVEGVKTIIPYHLQLMDDERFQEGTHNTKYLENSFQFTTQKEK